MTAEQIQALIAQSTEGPTFGIFGEPRVNVLKLNLMLDQWGQAFSLPPAF